MRHGVSTIAAVKSEFGLYKDFSEEHFISILCSAICSESHISPTSEDLIEELKVLEGREM